MSDKILLFIPMYNCEKQIIRVIEKLAKYEHIGLISEVLFIDNISRDTTPRVVKDNKDKIPVKTTLVQNDQNYGLGGSHKVAFSYAQENEFDYLIVLHGDDQGDINCLSDVLVNKTYKDYDCYLGARFHPKSTLDGYSLFRTVGNKGFNILVSLVAKRRVYDLGAGLNMYKVSFLKDTKIKNFANNLTFNVYLLLYSVFTKQKIVFFPLTWAELDQISNSKVISQGFTTLNMVKKYFLNPKDFFDEDNAKIENYTYKEVI